MHFQPIAYTRSPYKQKFAIPRQPNLVSQAVAEIVFVEPCNDPNCLREIEQFSHLWLIFAFHETMEAGWSPLVQPPRLGGREKVGVFASRATHRPNPLGMSAVELIGQSRHGNALSLRVRGIDLLDGTPILDIKPYLPYADSIPDARAGYAQQAPSTENRVIFCARAQAQLQALEAGYPELEQFIIGVLRQDPRPAWRHQGDDPKRYGMSLYNLNIKWQVMPGGFEVLSIEAQGEA